MASGTIDEKATLPEPGSRIGLPSTTGPALALTVLYHPDLRRVGDRVFISPEGTRVGRNEPHFSSSLAPGSAPLDDPHLSRSPFFVAPLAGGAVRVDATSTSTSVLVSGQRIGEATLGPDEIRRGTVLLVAGSVVLLLHLQRHSASPPLLRGEDLGLFGDSDGLRAVLTEVNNIADLTSPVLLRGESGSGKELVAQAIHRTGARQKAPFVAVNLGAIPPAIAAAELFGSERGAFTGAVRRRGYFEQAAGGTLFLDEIGEAPIELQVALLRALENGEIQPVGSDRARKVDVRIIAATDADLEARTMNGSFRTPLFNRLAAYQIWIPALRERRDDIGRLLVQFFREELRELGEHARLTASPGSSPWLPAALVARLSEHDWPGNVRQLRNVVRHLVIGNRSSPTVLLTPAAERLLESGLNTAPPSPAPPAADAKEQSLSEREPRSSSKKPRRKASDIDKEEILAALRNHRFEIAGAATELGIPRPTLDLAMTRLGIPKAGDLGVQLIESTYRMHGGELRKVAEALEVSERALLRRVRELGLKANGH